MRQRAGSAPTRRGPDGEESEREREERESWNTVRKTSRYAYLLADIDVAWASRRTLNITARYADSEKTPSVPRAGALADPGRRYRVSCRIRGVHRPPRDST